MLRSSERKEPYGDHYVGWPDMAEALNLKKEGLLAESGRALGCFSLTHEFRLMFGP